MLTLRWSVGWVHCARINYICLCTVKAHKVNTVVAIVVVVVVVVAGFSRACRTLSHHKLRSSTCSVACPAHACSTTCHLKLIVCSCIFSGVCVVMDVSRVAPHPNIIGVHSMDDRGPCPTLALECGDCDLFTEINSQRLSLPELLE